MESKLKISIFSTCKIILLAMLFIQPIFGQDAKVKEAVWQVFRRVSNLETALCRNGGQESRRNPSHDISDC